ncbi:MAG: phosphotransferase [Chlamydiia bacterium]|nr:phosphotransferase [Chlamydiia bacterium]
MNDTVVFYRVSCDPPHRGHLEALQTVRSALSPRKIYVLYGDSNPFKPFRQADVHRKAMLECLISGLSDVKLSDATARELISKVRVKHPDATLVHLVGSDLVRERMQRAPRADVRPDPREKFYVIGRDSDSDMQRLPQLEGRELLWAPEGQLHEQGYSSTEIRQHILRKGETGDLGPLGVPRSIQDYIQEHELYKLPLAQQGYVENLELLRRAVQNFAGRNRDLMEKYPYPWQIQLANDLDLGGMSGELVVLIRDAREQLVMVVKVYHQEGSAARFESECLGLQRLPKFIEDYALEASACPHLLFAEDHGSTKLLAMSPAVGISIQQLLLDVKKEDEHPDKERLGYALMSAGYALSELHQARTAPIEAISAEELAPFDEGLQKLLNCLPPQLKGYTDVLEAVWEARKVAFRCNPGRYSVTHGDPNPGNMVFVDSERPMTFIDLANVSRSLDADGEPHGFAANEFLEAVSLLWVAGQRIGLSHEEIEELQWYLTAGYSAFDEVYTPESLAFFDTYWRIRGVRFCIKQGDLDQALRMLDTLKSDRAIL